MKREIAVKLVLLLGTVPPRVSFQSVTRGFEVKVVGQWRIRKHWLKSLPSILFPLLQVPVERHHGLPQHEQARQFGLLRRLSAPGAPGRPDWATRGPGFYNFPSVFMISQQIYSMKHISYSFKVVFFINPF